eukprot:m.9777 g.9777  ORF g.9777 m.9777 type:complete len:760 (+) comp21638_c0_seq3:213-2492(+)
MSTRFLLLYASQTGQAEAIAKDEIFGQSESHGLSPAIFCLSQTEKKFDVEKESVIVFVASTTGDGDPPDTARKFWRYLRKKTHPKNHLKHIHFSLLGLGDSNYTNFCNFSKNLNKRLLELGAKEFYPVAFADDAIGLEKTVESWVDGLWVAVEKALGIERPKPKPVKKAPVKVEPVHRPFVSSIDVPLANGRKGSNGFPQLSPTVRARHSVFPKPPQKNGLPGKPKASSLAKEEPKKPARSASIDAATAAPKKSLPEIQRLRRRSTQESVLNSADLENIRKLMESLTCSETALSGNSLSLPPMQSEPWEVHFMKKSVSSTKNDAFKEAKSYPSAATPVFMAKIKSARRLTRHDAVKKALEIEMDVSGMEPHYEPGDSFSIVCQNSEAEVTWLISRLELSDVAHQEAKITVKPGATTRDWSHLPQVWTPYGWLKYGCDIRGVPKKMFLRKLAESTSVAGEKRRLLELCSKQGASEYGSLIRDNSLNLLDILAAFPSCKPSLQTLLNGLLRLQPRSYSVSSSRLVEETTVRFVFNVVHLPPKTNFSVRHGLCTGWLDKLTKSFQRDFNDPPGDSPGVFTPEVPIYFRVNRFRFPENFKIPVIMIGPGTGVAPFIGFLQQRQQQRIASKLTGMRLKFAETWLFFGCRHKERDFLFREQIETFVSDQTLTHLHLSFSREENQEESAPKYVQHNLKGKGKDIADLILQSNATIYVCGDAKNMAKDVFATFCEIFQEHCGKSPDEAEAFLKAMRAEKKYCEDVWI